MFSLVFNGFRISIPFWKGLSRLFFFFFSWSRAMKDKYRRSLQCCMKLWQIWNVLVFLFNTLCCFPQIQHAKPAKIQGSVCDLTGSCHKSMSYQKSKNPPLQDAEVFWRASSGLWTELLQDHKHRHHLQQWEIPWLLLYAASFLWRIGETDKDVTRNNSIIECPNENAHRHKEYCGFNSSPFFNFPMDI